MKKDSEIVFDALTNSGFAFEYADQSLKSDRSFILEVLKIPEWQYDDNPVYYSAILKLADESIRKDKEIILEALKRDHFCLVFDVIHESLNNDREVLLAAINCPSVFEKIDSSFQNNREF